MGRVSSKRRQPRNPGTKHAWIVLAHNSTPSRAEHGVAMMRLTAFKFKLAAPDAPEPRQLILMLTFQGLSCDCVSKIVCTTPIKSDPMPIHKLTTLEARELFFFEK